MSGTRYVPIRITAGMTRKLDRQIANALQSVWTTTANPIENAVAHSRSVIRATRHVEKFVDNPAAEAIEMLCNKSVIAPWTDDFIGR